MKKKKKKIENDYFGTKEKEKQGKIKQRQTKGKQIYFGTIKKKGKRRR